MCGIFAIPRHSFAIPRYGIIFQKQIQTLPPPTLRPLPPHFIYIPGCTKSCRVDTFYKKCFIYVWKLVGISIIYSICVLTDYKIYKMGGDLNSAAMLPSMVVKTVYFQLKLCSSLTYQVLLESFLPLETMLPGKLSPWNLFLGSA